MNPLSADIRIYTDIRLARDCGNIMCFIMTAHARQSAADPANPEPPMVRSSTPASRGGPSCLPRGVSPPKNGLPIGRGDLCAFAAINVRWMPAAATLHTAKILIANLELELVLTYGKLSPIRISNRKYSRVLRSPWRTGFPTVSQPLTYTESRSAQIDPRKPFPATSHSPLITHHSQLSTCHVSQRVLIYGCAIKTRFNSFESNNMQISNRR